ncbi:integrase core domain-containing protein [Corynebacterium pseudodiphtheriticum]|uniref:Integrase core domain-containing protein n=1 Tax=Corynebacterium pseudodiphtheriticum TaxID=37637 RepID=A0AAP4BQS4_9CORY|nr:integrase core domain-containing protein [Corynebacterium pseudodiphtheriticum]MCT1635229.1 integrase core domain-containing protein [Corynebacterium pseudodiphtheriticum]MCT1667051.1 integrase core domain-containing protein [Corynebacterium pseudodiphtheriticum]MDC7088754.1 integrase core domain-containing protein [Corynebacterium pseudodiphtheriticum]MDK4229272.1 integrase core domain-containing protein [Corynebacterium pseudodiphtheriticum]MDK4236535.1 integrase core domain-containing pr
MSTTSAWPSTVSQRPLGRWATPTDNALAENETAPNKNELIPRRTWADVVDVEIATFEWVNWWNESPLHQSLGYRTPAEVEAEFWEHHPSREIMEIKAKA